MSLTLVVHDHGSEAAFVIDERGERSALVQGIDGVRLRHAVRLTYVGSGDVVAPSHASEWLVGSLNRLGSLTPPFVDQARIATAELTTVQEVRACWSVVVPDSPFGLTSVRYELEDGKLKSTVPTEPYSCTYFVCSYLRLVESSARRRVPMSATFQGSESVSGPIDEILMIAGLVETEPWLRLMDRDPVVAVSQFMLGKYLGDGRLSALLPELIEQVHSVSPRP